MTKYKCNLIIPGFAKSGTSTLHEYLNLHPDICMSKPKETHFFAEDERYIKGPEHHNHIFEYGDKKNAKYFGESSTRHCLWKPALNRIKENLDNPKLIVILREPVERLLSHYRWLWALTLEKRPLLKAIYEEEKKGFHPDINLRGNYLCYIRSSNYSYWCPLIIDLFGKENVLFINSNELFYSKEIVLKKCFDFLLLPQIKLNREIHENKTGERGVQRTLGIQNITKLFPDLIKNKVDPNRKVKKKLYAFLGQKKNKSEPVFGNKEILEVQHLLKRDVEFYNQLFSVLK